MPKFIIEQPGVPPMTAEIIGQELTFGRTDDNDIVLVAQEVSRNHARIELQKDKTVLYDLKSLNGTYVNRQAIIERVLSDKDEIWFGSKCRLVFHDDSQDILSQRKQESTLILDLKKIQHEMEDLSSSMTMIKPQEELETGDTPASAAPMDMEKMARAFRRLDALYQATNLIASEFDLDKRLSDFMDLAIRVTNAERGFIMLKEESSDELHVSVMRDMGGEIESASPSMTIARKAALDGEPILMRNAQDDSKFGKRESIIIQRITSAMCVPMYIEGRIIGSLYIDTKDMDANFSEEDLEMFQALGNQAAMAIENVRLYERMLDSEKKRANLGRFMSPAIVEAVMEHENEIELGGQKLPVTVLYCDIRGFTPLSEGLSPEELVLLLNEHFTSMTEIVFKHQGTLDKFIGDEVMALFGAPLSSGEDSLQAVKAAIAMQKSNAELNELRREKNLPEFHIGIGINTGEAFSGYIGAPDRMDYTVIGDMVNVASRLCSIAQGEQIIIGRATFNEVKEYVECRSAGTPDLKGKTEAVEVFEILRLL